MAKILVVEDENTMSLLLDMILRRGGHETRLAEDGTHGLQLIYQTMPDLIVMDDMLPDMTGSDICYQIKHDSLTAHIPVLMYSAGAQIHSKDHIARIGADAALPKPSSPETLLKTIDMLLGVRHPTKY